MNWIDAPTLLLLLLASPLHAAAEHSNASEPSLRNVTFPGKTWALGLDLDGFEFSRRDARSDGKGISVFGSSDSTGLIISIYLEHAAGPGGARACRDYYLSKSKGGRLDRRDVSLSERNRMALVEYFGPHVGSAPLDNQLHVNAYMAHDGIWIDIHLSKMDFKPADRVLFDRVLDSIRIVGDTAMGTTPAVSGREASQESAHQIFNAPGGRWSVQVSLPGFRQEGTTPFYEHQGRNPKDSAFQHSGQEWHGASVERGLGMIVVITEANKERDPAACRATAWSRLKSDRSARLTEPQLFDDHGAAMIEYLVTRMDGRPANAKYVHAFYFRDGYCVGVSLFKVDFREEDSAAFAEVLQSIRLEEAPVGVETPPSLSSSPPPE